MDDTLEWPIGEVLMCPKCGNADIGVRWCSHYDYVEYPESNRCRGLRQDSIEHIHRNCRCCDYRWLERCLDDEEEG